MKVKHIYNNDKSQVTIVVELPLITNEAEHFTRVEAEKYLKENKIKYVKRLSGGIISNQSENRRKGQFVYLLQTPPKLKIEKDEEGKYKATMTVLGKDFDMGADEEVLKNIVDEEIEKAKSIKKKRKYTRKKKVDNQ